MKDIKQENMEEILSGKESPSEVEPRICDDSCLLSCSTACKRTVQNGGQCTAQSNK